MQYVATGCELLLAVVFLTAVMGKTRNRSAFRAFVGSVRRLNLLSPSRARAAAVMATAAEAMVPALFACALMPVGPLRVQASWFHAAALSLSLALLLAFTAVIALALVNGTQAPCRCFGARGSVLGVRHVIRNLFLVFAAVGGLLGHMTAAESGADGPGVVLAAATGAVLASVFVLFDDLVELFLPTTRPNLPEPVR
ncbi:hypothetical protein ADK41_09970 [Streptomyces caelestis]|uniref:Methylamine utilisation protein MauE domain-containing protein n=1 Tax=Streptomyces caelestis TaxID=36816 RepID=A0A0M8QLG9_9ACTN|nr:MULTISPECIES: MauE/DoxX family redox-associated membrane protein [Streptomyces]KOT41660.1 hypothetical protein ADK41_09970 [Streptomyces caelestis]KOV25116.1 hypothetical protein ADK58_17095 [Streptomyces sp. XY152]